MDRERRIKELARKYQDRQRHSRGNGEDAWDKAVQKVEREGSEASRGPAKPAPEVGRRSSPSR